MTLTVSQVQAWRPDALQSAATGTKAIYDGIDQQFQGLAAKQTTLNWRGKAGDAAADRITSEKSRAGRISTALAAVEKALSSQVADLENTKKAVLTARDNAVRAGFEVADEGAVTAEAKKSAMLRAGAKADDPAVVALDRDAAQAQADLVNALQQAEGVAERTRDALAEAAGDPGLHESTRTGATNTPAGSTAAASAAPPVTSDGGVITPGSSSTPHAGDSSGQSSHSGHSHGSSGGHSRHSGHGSHSGHGGFGGGHGPSGGPPASPPTGERAQWISEAMKILQDMGYDTSRMSPSDIEAIIDHESGGDPHAINLWDSNAEAGHPSKGLMQCIDSTFEAHKAPGHDDIWNPVDNIVAGVRYSIDRYGSVDNVPGIAAIRDGGSYVGY